MRFAHDRDLVFHAGLIRGTLPPRRRSRDETMHSNNVKLLHSSLQWRERRDSVSPMRSRAASPPPQPGASSRRARPRRGTPAPAGLAEAIGAPVAYTAKNVFDYLVEVESGYWLDVTFRFSVRIRNMRRHDARRTRSRLMRSLR